MKTADLIAKMVCGLAVAAPVYSQAVPSADSRMNVIFFLVDDMGWMDSSVYGSKFYETPAMERLAKSGIRFVNAYSASPLCSPSRASIMSGQYPARHGLTTAWGHMPIDPALPKYQESKPSSPVLLPNSKRVLELEQYTVAEAFHDAGYRTGFIGKWHLGLDEAYWPEHQGFEFTFHGAPDAGPPGSYFAPYKFKAGTVTDGPEGEYLTDRATDEALKYIHNGDHRPFFLCLWHWAVHGPWFAKQEMISYFKDRPDPSGVQKSPLMAAMLKSMDESLGRLLDDLEKTGLDKNTIIIFTSDNGGVVKKEIGPEKVPATCNAPLRNGKASVFEGGTRVPAIIRWPGVTDSGRVDETAIMGIDYYPTLLEMCGVPADPQQLLDGVSLVPVLKGGMLQRDQIFCFFPWSFGQSSPAGAWVRQGDWKLIEVYDPGAYYPDAYELYNLRDDIGETHNLAEQYPERVTAMKALLQQHYRSTGALLPIPNPGFTGGQPKAQSPDAPLPENSLPGPGFNGWAASGPGTPLMLKDGLLLVNTRGIATAKLPDAEGALKVCIRAKVSGAPAGAVFWREGSQEQFDADHRMPFDLKNGAWGEYEITFKTSAPLTGLRIDLGIKKSGPAQVEWIWLLKEDGTAVQQWNFSAQ